MGCFNVCCSISNLSIGCGDKVKFIPLKPVNEKPYIVESMLMYLNCYFNPALLPITGYYNDYGSLENIERDDNVLAIEKYYGVSIEEFLNTITEYSDGNEYGLGGMFVLDEVYTKMVEYALKDNLLYNKYIEVEVLEEFGFRKVDEDEQFFIHPHYKYLYRNDKYGYDLFIGNYGATLLPTDEKQYAVVDYRDINELKAKWVKLTKEDISTFPIDEDNKLSKEEQFNLIKDYLERKFGYTIGFSKTGNSYNLYSHKDLHDTFLELTGVDVDIDYLKEIYAMDKELDKAINEIKMFKSNGVNYSFGISRLYSTATKWAMLDKVYQEDILNGKLKVNMRELRAFESSMFSCNRFYFPAMNGEQCGNDKASKMLLDVSSKIIADRLKKYND